MARLRRGVAFFDTADRHLNNRSQLFRNYVFRRRVDSGTDAVEVTLKYRHPDRLVTEDRVMTASADLSETETKFEEDIKPVLGRMRSLYSFSRSGRPSVSQETRTVGDIVALFPNLGKHVQGSLDEPLKQVGSFTAREVVLDGAKVKLGEDEWAKCGLVVWYEAAGSGTRPVVPEFSFRHKEKADEAEETRFTAAEARTAFRVFRRAIGLTDWAALDSRQRPPTSTAWHDGWRMRASPTAARRNQHADDQDHRYHERLNRHRVQAKWAVGVDVKPTLEVGLEAERGDLTFGFGAGTQVTYAYYQLFETAPASPSFKDALADTISGFTIVDDLSDLRAMAPGSFASAEGETELKLSGGFSVVTDANPLMSKDLPGEFTKIDVTPGAGVCGRGRVRGRGRHAAARQEDLGERGRARAV